MIDPVRFATADAPQLSLPDKEMERLGDQVEEDFVNALQDHSMRMQRFQNYYKRFRNRTDPPEIGREDEPNFRVPITQWQVYSKLAKGMASLFGDDAEVIAKPVGPNDQRVVRKAARFETWRVFESMKIINPATTFEFRRVLFGRAHAYAPWYKECFFAPTQGGRDKRMTAYEGPGFFPLMPDDFIVPAEEAQTLHDFSYVIRRYRATPNDLMRGEDAGRYQGISDRWQDIIDYADDSRSRRPDADVIRTESDLAEGVMYEGSLSAANSLEIHEWYGRWRRLLNKRSASLTNTRDRDKYESELVIRYIPSLSLVVSVQDLAQMYPRMKDRRPFVEASLVKDGSYWGPSFGELLEDIEEELTSNHNLGTKAGQFSVGPVIVYRPAAGFDPEDFEYEPGVAIASEDPNSVKLLSFTADLKYPIAKEQAMIAYSERVTGITDQNIGRTQSSPNAPRTARQTLALLEEGDVRASLDMSALREDWSRILKHFWHLEQMYGQEKTFFRVTEEDSGGLFDTSHGGAYMTSDELEESYDFSIKFATNAWSKETNKQNQLSLYQLDLQNPLVINNPRALWLVLDKIHRAFGDDRFSDCIPEPPDLGLPVKPSEEWARALQGEDIQVNPLDNDQAHMVDHNRRLADAQADPDRDEDAYNAMVRHIREHIEQMKLKQVTAELTSRLAQSLASGKGGLRDGAAPMALQNLHGQIGTMIGAEGAEPPGEPGQPAQLPKAA